MSEDEGTMSEEEMMSCSDEEELEEEVEDETSEEAIARNEAAMASLKRLQGELQDAERETNE